jgi:hypothetical protein
MFIGPLLTDAVDALALAFDGLDSKTQLFGNLATNEAAHTVGLPPGRGHNLLDRGTRGFLQQADNEIGFGARSRR